jgi:hypothetical protein
MEHENAHFASRGVGNTALGLSIGALGAGLLSGSFGNLLGGGTANCGCNEDHYVNRYELGQNSEIERLRTELSLRDSNIYTDSKIADVYEKLNTKIGAVESELCQQRVYNATNTSAIACINGQIAQLMSLTSFAVDANKICPPGMPLYNAWVAPTSGTTTATT